MMLPGRGAAEFEESHALSDGLKNQLGHHESACISLDRSSWHGRVRSVFTTGISRSSGQGRYCSSQAGPGLSVPARIVRFVARGARETLSPTTRVVHCIASGSVDAPGTYVTRSRVKENTDRDNGNIGLFCVGLRRRPPPRLYLQYRGPRLRRFASSSVAKALASEVDIRKLRATAAEIRKCLMTWVSPLCSEDRTPGILKYGSDGNSIPFSSRWIQLDSSVAQKEVY